MAMNLTNFRIEALHNRRTIDLAIKDNKLVLVGDNGSGKTTILNILYYFLSRQWDKLTTYTFSTISATINGEEVHLSIENLQRYISMHRSPRLLFYGGSGFSMDEINTAVARKEASLDKDFKIVFPTAKIGEQRSLYTVPLPDDPLEDINVKLENLVSEQILYLPTYRRIEQDLKSIFPQIDIDVLLRRGEDSNRHLQNYIDLVEFGMEDVERRVSQTLDNLKDSIRNRLNALTGSYLREVISGQYKAVYAKDIEELQVEAVEAIISRIGDDILPEPEKARLRGIRTEIQYSEGIDNDQKIIAHFLIRLVEVYKAQQQVEANVRRFVDVCNNYLTGKQLVFDTNEFRVFVELHSHQSEGTDSKIITMKQLSSGEKQIVSLFSHLFLSDVKEFFILIDEPELSLSVPWQKRFLPDIINTGYCNGLIAATHSPFIFDNELDPYTHSVNEFWSKS